jgi:hypothetical protein
VAAELPVASGAVDPALTVATPGPAALLAPVALGPDVDAAASPFANPPLRSDSDPAPSLSRFC